MEQNLPSASLSFSSSFDFPEQSNGGVVPVTSRSSDSQSLPTSTSWSECASSFDVSSSSGVGLPAPTTVSGNRELMLNDFNGVWAIIIFAATHSFGTEPRGTTIFLLHVPNARNANQRVMRTAPKKVIIRERTRSRAPYCFGRRLTTEPPYTGCAADRGGMLGHERFDVRATPTVRRRPNRPACRHCLSIVRCGADGEGAVPLGRRRHLVRNGRSACLTRLY